MLSIDTDEARAIAREVMAETYNYFVLTNVSNWKWMGFTDADLTQPAATKFVDVLAADGTRDNIANHLGEHLRSGADDVGSR